MLRVFDELLLTWNFTTVHMLDLPCWSSWSFTVRQRNVKSLMHVQQRQGYSSTGDFIVQLADMDSVTFSLVNRCTWTPCRTPNLAETEQEMFR